MEAEPFGHADVVVGHLDPAAVGATKADQDFGLGADFLGAGEVATGLGVRDEWIGVALDNISGRGFIADPEERREFAAGTFASFGSSHDRSEGRRADGQGAGAFLAVAFLGPAEEIDRGVEAGDRVDLGTHLLDRIL